MEIKLRWKYRNHLRLLEEEQETAFNDYISSITYAKSTTKEEYQNWLFDYCFGDGIE